MSDEVLYDLDLLELLIQWYDDQDSEYLSQTRQRVMLTKGILSFLHLNPQFLCVPAGVEVQKLLNEYVQDPRTAGNIEKFARSMCADFDLYSTFSGLKLDKLKTMSINEFSIWLLYLLLRFCYTSDLQDNMEEFHTLLVFREETMTQLLSCFALEFIDDIRTSGYYEPLLAALHAAQIT